MHLQDHLLSCQLCPHSLQTGRKMEPYGSKRVFFFERSGLLGTKSGLKPWTQASANQPDHSDIVCECDVMLPIKGKHVRMLNVLLSDLWLWALGLSCGDRCSVVDGKAGLSFRDIVSISKGKTAFTPFLLLSLLRPNSPCAATTF